MGGFEAPIFYPFMRTIELLYRREKGEPYFLMIYMVYTIGNFIIKKH